MALPLNPTGTRVGGARKIYAPAASARPGRKINGQKNSRLARPWKRCVGMTVLRMTLRIGDLARCRCDGCGECGDSAYGELIPAKALIAPPVRSRDDGTDPGKADRWN
jgi:hypothetical protein